MDALLHAVVSNALCAVPLALLVAGITRVCRRPAVAHALWLLVLLKLLTPPLVALPVLGSPCGEGYGVPSTQHGVPSTEYSVLRTAYSVLHEPDPRVSTSTDTQQPATAASEVADEYDPAPSRTAALSWQSALIIAWLFGAALWWSLTAWRLGRFHSCLRWASPASDAIGQQAGMIAAALGVRRCPRVWFVPATVSPMLWAFAGAPRLLLPTALWEGLTETQRDTLLAHELAHWRRGDHWVRRLEIAALGLYWWHPVVWWARRGLHEAEEQCCDAWVVWALPAAAADYAEALVATVAFLSRPHLALPAAASGVGRVASIKRRLTMILREPRPRALSWPGFVAVLVAAAVLLPLRPGWAEPLADELTKNAEPGVEAPKTPAQGQNPGQPAAAPEQPSAATPQEVLKMKAAIARPSDTVPTVKFEQAKDEVDMMGAQLEIRKAELSEAECRVKKQERLLKTTQQLFSKGYAGKEALENSQDELAVVTLQLNAKKAIVREAEIRLRKAVRNLQSLASPAARPEPEGPAPAGRPRDERSLQDIEKKLDDLLKEVEEMRRSLRPKKASGSDGTGVEFMMLGHELNIPFVIDEARRDRVKEVQLYCSTDRGRTWQQIAKAGPGERLFRCRTSEYGPHWFAVRTLDRDGNAEPKDITVAVPLLQVMVVDRDTFPRSALPKQ